MNRSWRRVYGGFSAAGLLLIAVALYFWGAKEVRDDPAEVFVLTVAGGFALTVAGGLFSWFGISVAADVGERGNGAALVALAGAIFSMAIMYAGGSLGEGPSYWNNYFAGGLAILSWFLLWFLLELGGRISVSISEERDLATGCRMAGWFLAEGLILGRAVAGDWHSIAATVHDWAVDGWPALPLLATAVAIERWLRPSRSRPFPAWFGAGLLPGMGYLVVALVWLWVKGAWEGMPR